MTATSAARRVAVNLTWCVPGSVGGSEEYLCRQLSGFPDDDQFDITVFSPRGFPSAHPEVAERFTVVETGHDGRSRPRRVLGESTWLYRRTGDFDLVHHGGGTVPLRHRRPTVLTIHDLQYLTFPEYFRRHKLAYLKSVMPRSARRADVITVPTKFVKETVAESFGIDVSRIVVVPHGVESSIGSRATEQSELRQRFSLGDSPIVVFPAMTHPHKGHEFLLDVFAHEWLVANPDLRLVLIGGAGLAESAVNERIAALGIAPNVVKPGRVSDVDRDGILRMAQALVFPSQYEGFGAPVIEAMALGVPVVASDRACLPEVVGSAGLVLPLERDAWRGALDEIDRRRTDLVAAGHSRVTAFTAEASGAALRDAYRRLA